MSSHFKALVIVLVLGAVAIALGRRALCPHPVSSSDWSRRVKAGAFLLTSAYVIPNYWIFSGLAAVVLIAIRKREPNPLAMYAALVMILPPLSSPIPGFGGIEQLFLLTTGRLITLAFALPMCVALWRQRVPRSGAQKVGDRLVLIYIGFTFAVAAPDLGSATNMVRSLFLDILDIGIPYYLASRSVQSKEALRDVIGTVLAVGAAIGLIAAFETGKRWLLLDSIGAHMHLPSSWVGGYLVREAGGPVRAQSTIGNSISLGHLMMMLVPLWIATFIDSWRRFRSIALLLLILAGLLAALSRGPWVATAIAVLTYVLLTANLAKAAFRVGAIAAGLAVVLVITPVGNLVLPYLPFIGTKAQAGTVDYRIQLLEVSKEVFLEHPILGDALYKANPKMEVMRQGQGIIDIVNTYLDVALSFGLVGLAIFLAILLVAIVNVARSTPSLRLPSGRENAAICASMVGMMASIATTSPMFVISYLIWITAGICLGGWAVRATDAPRLSVSARGRRLAGSSTRLDAESSTVAAAPGANKASGRNRH